jgi:hypothetical protein
MINLVSTSAGKFTFKKKVYKKYTRMHKKEGLNMGEELTLGTWLWLLIPMPTLIILSIITFFTEQTKE